MIPCKTEMSESAWVTSRALNDRQSGESVDNCPFKFQRALFTQTAAICNLYTMIYDTAMHLADCNYHPKAPAPAPAPRRSLKSNCMGHDIY